MRCATARKANNHEAGSHIEAAHRLIKYVTADRVEDNVHTAPIGQLFYLVTETVVIVHKMVGTAGTNNGELSIASGCRDDCSAKLFGNLYCG